MDLAPDLSKALLRQTCGSPKRYALGYACRHNNHRLSPLRHRRAYVDRKIFAGRRRNVGGSSASGTGPPVDRQTAAEDQLAGFNGIFSNIE